MTVTCAPSVGMFHDLRVGFTLPEMVATLYRGDGTPVDLTDATSVRFKMRRRNRPSVSYKVDRTSGVTVLDDTAGIVEVDWLAADVDTADEYEAFFVVTFTDGNTLPVPNPDFIIVTVGRA